MPRVRLDCCFLIENAETATALDPHGQLEAPPVGLSQTVLVMQESLCRSVWAYAVEHKGSSKARVIDQIA